MNQLARRNGDPIYHEPHGNAKADPTTAGLDPMSPNWVYRYGYNSENLLTSVEGPGWYGTLSYDPLMRLLDAGAGGRTVFGYDGEDRIAEYYNGEQTIRAVHGPGIDEPLYTDGYGGWRWLHADERGSIIALSDQYGNVTDVNRYDEYGNAPRTNRGRFQFTGKPYETVSELHYSRARMYNHRLGRFMQPDPIRYDDGMNMYAYVGGDPVNRRDPTGLCGTPGQPCDGPDTVITRGWTLNPHWRSGAEGGGSRTGSPVGSTPEANTHLYDFDRDLTRRDTKCTAADVADALARFAVPGNDGVRVRDEGRYTVRQAIGWGTGFSETVGDVTVDIWNNGLAIRNTTLPGHRFHSGTVSLFAYPSESGGYSVRVRGAGQNSGFLSAVANEAVGPMVFKNQIAKMRARLNSTCGG